MSLPSYILLFVSTISFAVGLGSLFIPDSTDAQSMSEVLFQLISLIIIPLVTLFVAVSISQHRNEKKVEATAKVIQDLKDGIESRLLGIYESTVHISQISSNPHANILTPFVPIFVNNLNWHIREMSMGHIWEYNPSNFHAFVKKIFGYAEERILATSIVDPKTFWETPEALEYLEYQAELRERGVKIERYFFVEEEKKNEYLRIIGENLVRGVIVRVVLKDNIPEQSTSIIRDGGLVDKKIAISCVVDKESGTITKVDCWVGLENKIEENRVWLDVVQRFSKSLSEIYEMSDDEIKTQYTVIT